MLKLCEICKPDSRRPNANGRIPYSYGYIRTLSRKGLITIAPESVTGKTLFIKEEEIERFLSEHFNQ